MRNVDDILNDIKENESKRITLENELNRIIFSPNACKKRADSLMSGNIGEWSEIYLFYKILSEGKIRSAKLDCSGNMQTCKESYLPVIKIIREDDGYSLEYYTANDINGQKALKVYYKSFSESLFERTADDYKKKANDLLTKLLAASKGRSCPGMIKGIDPKTNKPKKGTYMIPDHKKYLNDILVTKLKSPSTAISDSFGGITDITLEIVQQDNLRVPVAFSVKSSLGSPAALLNSSESTIAVFRLENCTRDVMNKVNSIHSKQRIVDRVRYLLKQKQINIVFDRFNDDVFESNLKLIADREPEVLGYAVLYSYDEPAKGEKSNRKMTSVLESLVEKDPLKLQSNTEKYYEKRLKDLLFEKACGMEISKPWDGDTKIGGGYLFVSKDGDVSAFYASDQDVYKNWLLNNTKFDTPSTGRQDIGEIKPENGHYYFTLNVLIKFLC